MRSLHPFPARMAPQLATAALNVDAATPLTVLDPMCGSGTVLYEAQRAGHLAIGIDSDPLATLLSQAMLRKVDLDGLLAAGNEVLTQAQANRSSYIPAWPDHETQRFVEYWFDTSTIHEMHALATSIRSYRGNSSVQRLLWCAFSRMIIVKAGGVSRAMDLSHSRPHRVYSHAPSRPFDRYMREVSFVASRGATLWPADKMAPDAHVFQADARALPIRNASVDCVVTSPPYLNAIDYIRTSKFTLVWMGYPISNLGKIRSALVGADSGRGAVFSDRLPETRFGTICDLETRYQGIVARYVNDILAVVGEIARVLRQNGTISLVIGNCAMRGVYIENAEIVKWAMEQTGIEVCDESIRAIPDSRRYLPPPPIKAEQPSRLRQEVVISARKP